jgi:hypothetical protein
MKGVARARRLHGATHDEVLRTARHDGFDGRTRRRGEVWGAERGEERLGSLEK